MAVDAAELEWDSLNAFVHVTDSEKPEELDCSGLLWRQAITRGVVVTKGVVLKQRGCWQVGAIDWERIDLTWEAAIKHGFALVPDPV